MIGQDDIIEIMAGIALLALTDGAQDDYLAYLGIDAEGLYRLAGESAEEEFELLSGLPASVPAEGRLRALNLPANARKEIKQALTDTFVVAFQAGVAIEKERK